MLAAVCAWHEFHEHAWAAISVRLESSEELIVASAALIEMYAVLTRLPAPHRLSPMDALTLVKSNFMDGVKIVSLTSNDYKRLIATAPARQVAGGRTYDAVIADCARKGKASTVLTFNPRDFSDVVANDVTIIVPGENGRT